MKINLDVKKAVGYLKETISYQKGGLLEFTFKQKYGRTPSGAKDAVILQDMKSNPSRYGIKEGVLPEIEIKAANDIPEKAANKTYYTTPDSEGFKIRTPINDLRDNVQSFYDKTIPSPDLKYLNDTIVPIIREAQVSGIHTPQSKLAEEYLSGKGEGSTWDRLPSLTNVPKPKPSDRKGLIQIEVADKMDRLKYTPFHDNKLPDTPPTVAITENSRAVGDLSGYDRGRVVIDKYMDNLKPEERIREVIKAIAQVEESKAKYIPYSYHLQRESEEYRRSKGLPVVSGYKMDDHQVYPEMLASLYEIQKESGNKEEGRLSDKTLELVYDRMLKNNPDLLYTLPDSKLFKQYYRNKYEVPFTAKQKGGIISRIYKAGGKIKWV